MQSEAFKPRAYEKAAAAISELDHEVSEMYARGKLKALEEIPSVGASIAEKIEELIRTGKSEYHRELAKKTPVDLGTLSRIEGLGPKSIKKLYDELGVRNMKELERAARAGKISKLEGFGKKSEDNILKSIESLKRWGNRFALDLALQESRVIAERLRSLPGVERVVVAGSLRRRKETIGDIDVLVVAKEAGRVMDFFVHAPDAVRVYAHGETKSAIKLSSGLDVDLRVVPEESFGAALNYFTGSKEHNVALRQIALRKGYKLNEYGLYKGKKQIAGRIEEELYRALGMDYIEPEMREDMGEIQLAQKHQLPELVGYRDLMGDLQVQTNWTDGSHSIEAMARAAAEAGLSYIAITDHTKRLAMTGGLDEKRVLAQISEIDRVNKKLRGKIRVLKGSECDILKDGTLDLSDSVLAKLDVVGASVHSHFNLSRADQTKRISRAMENPHADILFHPTGRIINRRSAYDADMDELIRVAKKTGTVMEIDALPDRLDLKDEHVRKCVEAGVKLTIDSDAHSPQHFHVLEYGIAQARRGFATRGDVINAWPIEKMQTFLK